MTTVDIRSNYKGKEDEHEFDRDVCRASLGRAGEGACPYVNFRKEASGASIETKRREPKRT